jgi:hypothetical protein
VIVAWLTSIVGLSAFNQTRFLVNHLVTLDEFSRCKFVSSFIKIKAANKCKKLQDCKSILSMDLN